MCQQIPTCRLSDVSMSVQRCHFSARRAHTEYDTEAGSNGFGYVLAPRFGLRSCGHRDSWGSHGVHTPFSLQRCDRLREASAGKIVIAVYEVAYMSDKSCPTKTWRLLRSFPSILAAAWLAGASRKLNTFIILQRSLLTQSGKYHWATS